MSRRRRRRPILFGCIGLLCLLPLCLCLGLLGGQLPRPAQEEARVADADKVIQIAASKPWLAGLSQIPATGIDKGVLRNVPYKSYRAGDYEVNVYGDLDKPACVEIGVYHDLIGSVEAKRNCLDFVSAVFLDVQDHKALAGRNLDKDTATRIGWTVEVTRAHLSILGAASASPC